jgi:hypothetical protein
MFDRVPVASVLSIAPHPVVHGIPMRPLEAGGADVHGAGRSGSEDAQRRTQARLLGVMVGTLRWLTGRPESAAIPKRYVEHSQELLKDIVHPDAPFLKPAKERELQAALLPEHAFASRDAVVADATGAAGVRLSDGF